MGRHRTAGAGSGSSRTPLIHPAPFRAPRILLVVIGRRSAFKANNVKARWQETTENDGKPLTISITHGANGLVYSAKKAGVLWLTGNVSVCLSGRATEITLKNTEATSNVPRLA